MKTKTNIAVKIVLAVMCVLSMLAFAFTVQPAKADGAMIMMKDGGSIRYIAPAGIRFSAYASEDLFTDEQLDANAEVGMLLVQEGKGTASDLTLDTQNTYVKKVSSNDAGFVWAIRDNDVDGFKRFNVVVTNIPEEAYGTTLYVNAYVKIGSNVTYATNDQARSIANVSNSILAQDQIKPFLSVDNRDTLNGYIVDGATGIAHAGNDGLTHARLEGGNIVWTKLAGAVGYWVGLGDQTINVIQPAEGNTVSLALSEFTATEGKITIVAYGDGETKTMSRSQNVYALDVPGGIASSITNGMSLSYNNLDNVAHMNVTVTEDTDGLDINILSDSWRSSVFGVDLKQGLDLTSHTGIIVKFRVNSVPNYDNISDYRFALSRGGLNYNAEKYYTVINSNEWQSLYLFNSDLSGLYSAGETRLQFIAYCNSGNGSNGALDLTLGEIKYFDAVKLSAPTNVEVTSDGVVTWDAVANADGYEVDVNGTTYNVTENTYTLTDLTTLQTIKVYATSNNIDSYLKSEAGITAFDPTPVDANMILDFNTEADYAKLFTDCPFATKDAGWNGWKLAPQVCDTKVTDVETAVQFAIGTRNYYHYGSGGHQVLNDVYVTIDGGLDVDKGIQVRFQVYNLSDKNSFASATSYFKMIGKTKIGMKTNEGVAYTSVSSADLETLNGSLTQITDQATWLTLTITSDQLKALGYVDGDTYIGFVFVRSDVDTGMTGDANNYGAWIRFDYIKYVD